MYTHIYTYICILIYLGGCCPPQTPLHPGEEGCRPPPQPPPPANYEELRLSNSPCIFISEGLSPANI